MEQFNKFIGWYETLEGPKRWAVNAAAALFGYSTGRLLRRVVTGK